MKRDTEIYFNKSIKRSYGMFIFSVRASSIRFFAILALAFAVLVGVMMSGGAVFASGAPAGEFNFSGIKSEDDRVAFVEQFGLKVKGAHSDACDFVMPENFDRVIMGYNEIQKRQGLDLSKYAGKKVTRYTYEIDGYEGYDGEVFVNLLVYRNRVIGCDISSGAPDGFVKPLVA